MMARGRLALEMCCVVYRARPINGSKGAESTTRTDEITRNTTSLRTIHEAFQSVNAGDVISLI